MKKKQYIVYEDPGHGWLKTTRVELVRLGIADKISSCSYQRGKYVYLEEDCDLPKLHSAKTALGFEVTFKELVTDRSSKIRSYEPYSQEVLCPQ
jgi:hypothetical protein